MMIKKLLVLAMLLTVATTTFGQVDKEYTQTLRKMFEVSGSEESYQAVIKQMISMYKQQYSMVKADVWEELEKEVLKTSLDNLTEMLAPVYQKYMNLEDLRELIKFYQTPVGKKFAKNTPFIMQESMQVGQEWGMQIGQDFIKKMKEKGY
jgi:hypothetical protein